MTQSVTGYTFPRKARERYVGGLFFASYLNYGAIIRQWALAGTGIAYKSIWDVKHDIAKGKLITIQDNFVLGFQQSDKENIRLQLVYPSRLYLPRQVSGFIEFFQESLSD